MIALIMASAWAQVDPACADVAAGDAPGWYVDDQHQQDFLLNFFALATTFSPIHAPIPNEPGHGDVGLEMSLIPPLSCDRRLVLSRTKTEDTNKAPILPRPRGTFTFPAIGRFRIYGGAGYVPPVTVFGTRNVIASGEVGLGWESDTGWQLAGRYHWTLMKTIAEIAGPFDPATDPVVLDFFSGSTFGVDLMAGKRFEHVLPYVALGLTDASTFFYIGDDAVVSNNLTPYFGPVASLGVQGDVKRLVFAGELYAAPNTFDASLGHLYTARVRAGVSF
ncbi:MAG: hypothetical protein KC621_00265 [Myxococcales bacterium]|nr:hypothetical protein [Myxococcales bacterium]